MENKSTGGIVGILVILLIWSFFFHSKYEGQTAEEWFNDYDSAEAQLETTKSEYEDFTASMENETNLKDCIERDRKLTLSLIDSMCNHNVNGCLQDRSKIPAFDNLMASSKESQYSCFQDYLDAR